MGRIYLAIFGLWPSISVKWMVRSFSISLRVFALAFVRNFKLLRQLAALGESLILSGKAASQSLQIRPLTELLKKTYCVLCIEN